MNFGEKLRTLRRDNKLTQQELSQKIGVSTVTIQSWERNIRYPGMEHLIRIGRTFNVSLDTMLGLKDLITLDSLPEQEQSLILLYRTLDDFGRKVVDSVCRIECERVSAQEMYDTRQKKVVNFKESLIPHFSLPSAAGVSAPLDDNNFTMISVKGYVPPETDYAINIQGNSMFPHVQDGEMVFVKKQDELNIGDIGIFCVDGAMYCKQYYRTGDGIVMLVSANPALRDTNIILTPDCGRSVSVCGKVLLGKRIELPKYLSE